MASVWVLKDRDEGGRALRVYTSELAMRRDKELLEATYTCGYEFVEARSDDTPDGVHTVVAERV